MSPADELAQLLAQPLPGGRGFQQARDKRIAYLKQQVLIEAGFGPIIRDTIMGPKEIMAPVGWKYDKTAIIAWAKLVECTRERRGKLKTKRDGIVLDGKCEALANVLANSLGMAGFFWLERASLLVEND